MSQVTMKGLEDQLLGDVVRKERPELEEAKDRLVVSISNDKRQLQELEDKVRARGANRTGAGERLAEAESRKRQAHPTCVSLVCRCSSCCASRRAISWTTRRVFTLPWPRETC